MEAGQCGLVGRWSLAYFSIAAYTRPRSSHVSIPDEGIALKVKETEGITRRKVPL